jgi:hypothetical protein
MTNKLFYETKEDLQNLRPWLETHKNFSFGYSPGHPKVHTDPGFGYL